jgi:hypothetical protein
MTLAHSVHSAFVAPAWPVQSLQKSTQPGQLEVYSQTCSAEQVAVDPPTGGHSDVSRQQFAIGSCEQPVSQAQM